MKSKAIYITEYIFAELFIIYSMIQHFMNPGTFISELCSFSNVWLLVAAILIFIATYRKNHQQSLWLALKNWQKRAIIVLFTAGIVISAVNLYFIRHPAVSKNPDAKIVILLGGGIDKNGELPKTVKNRCDLAAQYLLSNPDAIVIATGGSLKKLPAEAPATKKYLSQKGIEPERILEEPEAKDTIQNFQYSCKMLAEYFNVPQSEILNRDIVVVTSFFHLARAERLARRMGFTRITGLGTKTPAIKLLDSYSREICSYIKLNLRILLTGKPKPIYFPIPTDLS